MIANQGLCFAVSKALDLIEIRRLTVTTSERLACRSTVYKSQHTRKNAVASLFLTFIEWIKPVSCSYVKRGSPYDDQY
jgi:hypothetical protein